MFLMQPWKSETLSVSNFLVLRQCTVHDILINCIPSCILCVTVCCSIPQQNVVHEVMANSTTSQVRPPVSCESVQVGDCCCMLVVAPEGVLFCFGFFFSYHVHLSGCINTVDCAVKLSM